MRRGLFVLALLALATFFQAFAAAPAQAFHHHGYGGWGHHGGWGHGWGYGGHRYYGWGGHRNWGFGRGYVYRPYYRNYNYGYRPYYGGYGYRGLGYGGLGYGGYSPGYNIGYYPNYGYSNYYNSGYYNQGCYCQPTYSTGYSNGVYYNTQYQPASMIYNNYYGANGGVSTPLTAGTVISQVANVLQQQRANNPNGRLLQGKLFNGNGNIREVVQNLTQGGIRNEPLNNSILVRSSNSDSRTKARAYLTQGDNLFRDQRYAAAAQQYRAAASLAPDIAECNWRYAHTLVAMGETDLAVSAVQRALAANPDTTRGGFTLDTLYGNIGTAKDSHLERLAQQVLDTESPNAYFLLGFTLRYSGETERATKFFARAAELQGRDTPHVVAFLGPAPKARPEPPPLLARLPAQEI